MKSGYRIGWSDEALNNLDSIIDYLTINWTEKEIRNFYKLLEKRLALIAKNPLAFPACEFGSNVKRCKLSKQTTIYFELKTDYVVLLSLFDNRKDPGTLKIEGQID
jgi:plasmid stabilization system protein ParE